MKIVMRAVIAVLLLSSLGLLKAQDALSDSIRAAISGPECVVTCFLGIEPGITSAAEAVAIFEANDLLYEKGVVPNLEGYTYVVSLPDVDHRFPFVDGDLIIDILQPPDLDHEVVTSVTVHTKPINVTDIINSFGKDPDRITSSELVYVDEQVTLSTDTTDEGVHIDSIRLYRQKGIELTLAADADIRPCVEPEELCLIPPSPFVAAFNVGNTHVSIGDQRLFNRVYVAFKRTLDITAEIDPQRVGSVVFTEGDTTFIDNTYPYTWRPDSPGRYELEARPYSEAGGQGVAGTPLSVPLEITAPK